MRVVFAVSLALVALGCVVVLEAVGDVAGMGRW